MGYFDPFALAENKSDLQVKKYREAELKHGRLAMLAALGILVQEKFNPLFSQMITGPAIYHFQQADILFPKFWLVIGAFIAWIEGEIYFLCQYYNSPN